MNKLTESRTRQFEAASADFRAGLVHFALGFRYLFRSLKHLVTGALITFIFLALMPAKGLARTYNTLTSIDTNLTNSGWDTFDECVATQTVTTDWGVSASTNLYVTWDSGKIYIGLHAGLKSTDEILVYFDMDYQAANSTGAASLSELVDNSGSIDNTASYCGVAWTDADFKPDFCIGWSADTGDNVEGVRGWVGSGENTKFSGTSFGNFGWYTPYSISNDGANTGDFEVVLCSTKVWTTAPANAKIALLVVIANDGSLSNQFLPSGTSGSDLTPYVVQVTNSAGELLNKRNPARDLPGRNSVVISEVFYNDNLTTDIDDWVELYNAANYSISLNNWKMRAWDEAMTTVYDMKLPNVSISSGTWLLVHPKAGTDRTNYWGIKEVYKGSNEDWFGTGAGTCELYDSSYTITAKTIVDFFVWDYDGTLAAVDVDSCAVTANIWVDGTFFDGGTASTNQSIERIDNSSETYKHPSPISAFDDDVAPCASEGVDNNGGDSPTAAKILGVVTTTSDFATNTTEVTEGTTLYFKINMDGTQDNGSYQQTVICKATSTSDQTGIFVTARENGINSNDYQGLIKLTLTSPSTSAMDALWAPAGDMITVRTLVNAVYYDTVTVVAGANNAPDAPTKFGQYSEAWTAINWGAWTNYQVMRASFTLTDPDTDDKLQFNIQISSHSDYSFCYINSTAPATAVLDEGTTNFLTTRAVALIPEGTWYWRVKATDDDGATGAYASSDTANDYHFRVDVSTPNNVGCSKPANNSFDLETSTTLVALIAVDKLSGVYQYELEVSTTSAFNGTGDKTSGWQAGLTYAPGGLLQDTTYYWRVRAKDNVGNVSAWCGDADTAGYWKFITINDPPNAPTKFGQYLENWTPLTWESWTNQQVIRASFTVTDPDSSELLQYNIQFSTYSNFSFCYINSTAPATATLAEGTTNFLTTRAVALIPEGTWYWRVMATDDGGLSSAYASSNTANGYHLRIDVTASTNVGCSAPANNDVCISVKTSLTARTAADSLSGVYQYQFCISTATTFNGTSDETSAWQSGLSWTQGTQLSNNATYYWRVRAQDNAENISNWCGAADTVGYYKFITELRGIDGDASDWTGSPTTIDNTSQISGVEWIWRDKSLEERQDGDHDSDVDLREVRVCADSNAIYFLVKFADMTDTQYPYVAVGIDTNTTSSGMNWVADEATVSMGDEYGRYDDKNHFPEQNIIVHYTDATYLVQIEKATGTFAGNWHAPATYGGGACNFSVTNDAAEFKIARSDLGLGGNKTARFTVSLYDNFAGWANSVNTTIGFATCDALDSMSIARLSTVSSIYNDNNGSMGSWDEEISDTDIDFWAEVRIAADGTVSNNAPDVEASAPSPADNGKYSTDTKPPLSWTPGSDSDSGDYVTSYMIEFATHTDLGSDLSQAGEYGYRVNIASTPSPSWTIPNDLKNDLTYYWRVYSRDACGALSSSPSVWAVKVDSIPPAAVTDIDAVTGSSPGDIDLTWTSPGDNGLSDSISGGQFLIKYSSKSTDGWGDMTNSHYIAANVSAGEIYSKTMTGLTEGVTYYFYIETADEIPNWSALSNKTTAYAYVNPLPSAEAQMVYYSSSTVSANQQFPSFRNWAGTAWSGEYSAKGVTSSASGWHVLKKAPSRDEWILGVQDAVGHLNVQIYNNTTKTWGNIKELSTYGSYTDKRRFDIAYKQQTGDAVIVYNIALGNAVQMMKWDGSSYSSEYTLNLSTRGSGTPNWIRLEAKPSSDLMLLGIQDSVLDISFQVLDDTTPVSGSGIVAEWETEGTLARCFDIAWEQITGRGMVVWAGAGADNYYRIWDGSSWAAQTAVGMGALAISVSNGYWIRLAACPGSKNILLGTVESSTLDLDAAVWNGTSWGSAVELNVNLPDDDGQYYDLAWESSSGDGIAVYTVNTCTAAYRTFTAGSWNTQALATPIPDGAYVRWVRLAPDDDSDAVMLVHSDTHSAVNVQKWDGSTWGTITEVENNASLNYQCFDAAYPLKITVPDITAPAAISDLTALAEGSNLGGRIKLKWTAPGDDGASGDNSGGQYLVKYSTKYIGPVDFYASWVSTWGTFTPAATPGAETLKILTGFLEGTTYFFAVRTKDNSDNWSVWPGTAANINSLSWSLPTSSAPAAITSLSALTGSSAGAINLTWTSPGDDGTTGTISLGEFRIKYSSRTDAADKGGWNYISNYVSSSCANIYLSQTYTKTIAGLLEGVTYYFRIWTADEQPNWSAISNAATAWAYITPPPATVEGMLVYYSSATSPAPQQIPKYRYWDGSAWAGELSAVDVGGIVTPPKVVRMNPAGDEALMVTVEKTGTVFRLYVSTYTPSGGWGTKGVIELDVGITTKRVFDAAYEQTSGEALIVYRDHGDSDGIYFVTWDGTSISAVNGPDAVGDKVGGIQWMRLEAKPGSDEITLVYSDDSGNIYAAVWNGSAFGNSQNLLTGRATANAAQPFDIAYAQSAGVAFVVWVDTATTKPKYKTWDGSSWSAAAETSHNHSAVGDARWIKAAANPKNNEIMIGTFDNSTDINAEVFSSTSNVWMNGTEFDGTAGGGLTARAVAVSFEKTSGEGLIVWADIGVTAGATPAGKTYINGVWATQNGSQNPINAQIKWIQLAPDDASDDIFLITLDTANYVYSQRWNGAAWDTLTEISNNSDGANESASMNFPKTTAPADSIAPAAVTSFTASTTSVAGRINLSWINAGDDYRIGRFASGSKFRIQYATYTAMAWGSEATYNVEIATSAISAQSVSAYSTSGLIFETTYYFRIWTGDEITNWSPISVGATAYCRVAPAAITTLSALAIDDGDIQLSWIAPGDDGTNGSITGGQWKIRYSTISTVDWTTASAGWTDEYDKYEFLIDTSCAALSEHAKTISGLHGGVTYYFRIWTRDEATGINAPGNWSGISNGSTACVVSIIGISVSTNTYNFGEVNLSGSSVTASGITVTNTGNVDEDYSMRVSSITLFDSSPSVWKSTDTTVGYNRFILYGLFHGARPESGYFVVQDTVTAVNQTSGDERYTYDGSQKGATVPKQEERTLWLRLDMPTSVYTSKQEKITVTITAGESP
ncbi:hypothetical protein FP828_03285 [bacterium]|nr:hypothetical protein [bacterium]